MLDGHDAPVTAVALGVLDGREVVVTGDAAGAVRWWDADSGELIGRACEDVPGPVGGVAAGEAGDFPFVAALDDDGVLTVWDADTTVDQPALSCPYRASHGPYPMRHRDREVLLVADHQRIMTVDARTGRYEEIGTVVARIGAPPRYESATEGHDSCMSVFAAGMADGWPQSVTGDIWGYHYVWGGLTSPRELTGGSRIESTALAVGRSHVVRADTAGDVWVHDLTGAALPGPLTGCAGRVVGVGVTPDAVVAASVDGTVRRWTLDGRATQVVALAGVPAAMAVSARTGRAWTAVDTTVAVT